MSCACVATCDCCAGARVWTPEPIANRPGLAMLAWRAGTQGTFLQTMLARLSSAEFPALAGWRTRERADFGIALLDTWATLADVLAFYDERLANEGFLRTATERLSVTELARLVGYRVRPGVAASVYLAFELEKDSALTLPAGTAAQSQPGPGELPQTFETSEPLAACTAWNALEVRRQQPQVITLDGALTLARVWLAGTATGLKAGDALLFDFGLDAAGTRRHVVREVSKIVVDNDARRTEVVLRDVPRASLDLLPELRHALSALDAIPIPPDTSGDALRHRVAVARGLITGLAEQVRLALPFGAFTSAARQAGRVLGDLDGVTGPLGPLPVELQAFPAAPAAAPQAPAVTTTLRGLIAPLLRAPALQPANALRLQRDLRRVLHPQSATLPQLVVSFHPQLATTLYASYAGATVPAAPPPLVALYALRVRAPLFGYNAPTRMKVDKVNGTVEPTEADWPPASDETSTTLFLDAGYDGVEAGTVVLVAASSGRRVVRVAGARVRTRTAYTVSLKTTEVTLDGPSGVWRSDLQTSVIDADITPLRSALVLAQSEALELADEPITTAVTDATLELARLYDGLEPGRWLAVSGTRVDVGGTTAASGTELVMVAGVAHAADPARPGDKPHTTLTLADGGLAYEYERASVSVRANVVVATHGATQKETLGSGDGARRFQTFALKKPPLTHVAAATAAGAAGTLEVRVDDLLWRETDALAFADAHARVYETRLDDDGTTSVVFGDGVGGARLPTGALNVKALYRSGLGVAGNVAAGAVSLLQSKPLGVKGVLNPLPASGGADAEARDQARRNAPLAVTALDRLVSVQDYADFARTFAGIAKASARRLSDGHREVVHVTVAGAGGLRVDERSNLYVALLAALRKLGDPHVPVVLAEREGLRLTLAAKVRLQPDRLWEAVAPELRAALVGAFGFDARELGQPVRLSEVLAALHRVAGVDAVDVDIFRALSAADVLDILEPAPKDGATAERPGVVRPRAVIPVRLARRRTASDPPDAPAILPAQLATLASDVPDTLVLTEMPR